MGDVVVEGAGVHIDTKLLGENALMVGVAHFVEDGGAHGDLGADVGRRAKGGAGPGEHADLADRGDFDGLAKDFPVARGEFRGVFEQFPGLDAGEHRRLHGIRIFRGSGTGCFGHGIYSIIQ